MVDPAGCAECAWAEAAQTAAASAWYRDAAYERGPYEPLAR